MAGFDVPPDRGPVSGFAVRRNATAHLLVDDVAAPLLDADAQHHLFDVLRARTGETVTVTDGRGRWQACAVVGRDLDPSDEIVVETPRTRPLTIGFAIPKRDRPEWIVQKLTELGVDRIVLLHAERSVVRWDGARGAAKTAKLGRVAREALQQSRGVFMPVIDGPLPVAELLPEALIAEPGGRPIEAADSCVLIGPEGGWSDGEIADARDRVCLGQTVLRVETAAVVCAAALVNRPVVPDSN